MKIKLKTIMLLTKTFRRLAGSRGLVTSPGSTSHRASLRVGGVRLLQPGRFVIVDVAGLLLLFWHYELIIILAPI